MLFELNLFISRHKNKAIINKSIVLKTGVVLRHCLNSDSTKKQYSENNKY